MKYEGTMLVVKDMEVARRFHQEVLSVKVALDLGTYVVFEGGYCLMTQAQLDDFQNGRTTHYQYGNNVFQLGFETGDLDAFLEHMNRFPGIEIITPLREYPWGQRSIRFYDPDRHTIEVGEDMKVVTKRCLKSGMTFEQTLQKVMYPPEFIAMCQKELEQEGK